MTDSAEESLYRQFNDNPTESLRDDSYQFFDEGTPVDAYQQFPAPDPIDQIATLHAQADGAYRALDDSTSPPNSLSRTPLSKRNLFSRQDAISALPRVIHGSTVNDVSEETVVAASKVGRNWNADFQKTNDNYQALFRDVSQLLAYSSAANQQLKALSEEIRQLTGEFTEAAVQYAQIIIEETIANIPNETRRIPSVDLGGIAGGAKFLHDGMIFKFAADFQGIFGGDEFAMKAASHELKGVIAFAASKIVGLYIPLMCVVDYYGFRMVATSVLPLSGRNSLVYGSCDGGVTVEDKNPEVAFAMRSAAKIFNIKAHCVGSEEKLLYGPGDIEVHIGRDGRAYVLDTARLFPPAAPVPNGAKGAHLYNLLRPEFVRRNPVPLCSDAFSYWGRHGIREHNQEIRDATARLEQEVIPKVVQQLDDHPGLDDVHVNAFCHERGVNMRYLGAMYALSRNSVVRDKLLIEMVSRLIKTFVRAAMRNVQCQVSEVVVRERDVIAESLNHAFGCNRDVWEEELYSELVSRFACNIGAERLWNDMRSPPILVALLRLVAAATGVTIDDKVYERLVSSNAFEETKPLHAEDISGVTARRKHTQLLTFFEGFASANLAVNMGPQYRRSPMIQELAKDALEKFGRGLELSPDDYTLVFHTAMVYDKIYQEHRTAEKYYKRCLELNPSYSRALAKYATLLYNQLREYVSGKIYYMVYSWTTFDGGKQ
eukprot:TRINITY_DN2189_c0_g1_i3.p1 TRINITY_DN2189_c0_g1~~TRINITY_DN2189_c0_g1_i3.p1  ORF type:complete len:714 (-),score=144.48 TRINITY_DN2189_c0_g1_i3:1496-3637(-)